MSEASKAHKLTWIFMRGNKGKLNCSCGLQSSKHPFPEGKDAMMDELRRKHRA